MYEQKQPTKHHHSPVLVAILTLVVISIIAVVVFQHLLQKNTQLIQAPAYTYYVSANDNLAQTVSRSVFMLNLPAGWQPTLNPGSPYTIYSWHGITTDAERRIDVYVDSTLSSLAVNRLLPVKTSGDHITVIGDVSGNCATFSTKTNAAVATGYAPAQWQGISFLCDIGNYERDEVAVGSAEGLNSLTLKGETTGTHHILLVYTDNSASPDYALFESVVQSFHLQ